jgi:hypothetical protein
MHPVRPARPQAPFLVPFARLADTSSARPWIILRTRRPYCSSSSPGRSAGIPYTRMTADPQTSNASSGLASHASRNSTPTDALAVRRQIRILMPGRTRSRSYPQPISSREAVEPVSSSKTTRPSGSSFPGKYQYGLTGKNSQSLHSSSSVQRHVRQAKCVASRRKAPDNNSKR